MGQYTSFIKDFPSRCRELLVTYPEERLQRGLPDRSVTTMLCVASAVLTIPQERLKKATLRNGQDVSHPERHQYAEATLAFDTYTGQDLALSNLWEAVSTKAHYQLGPRPTEFHAKASGPFFADYKVWEFIRVLRNALAHGNIYTGDHPKRITNITFGSRVDEKRRERAGAPPGHYELITLGIGELSAFLHAWLDFLAALPIPEGMQDVDEAAD
ncbi:hypothetical protein Q0M94_25960 (plasmid) [Deinococcus radiomollis]|uniref:hypothetical protein n=1 Tax=Deinococcus radiomollis TaxID=468916 RepID=UPI0038913429